MLSFTISYRTNYQNSSSVWTLQMLNATSTKEFDKDYYNIKTNTIEQKFSEIMILNLSYKIEF